MAEDIAPHGTTEPAHSEHPAAALPADPQQTPEEQEPVEPETPQQGTAGKLISAAIVLVALVLAAIVILQTNQYPRTDDAEVLANFIGMAPIVNGPITEVDVRDNQLVHTGDVLFRVDDRPYKYALQRAISQQAQLEGQIYNESLNIRSQHSAALAAQAATLGAQANVVSAKSTVAAQKAGIGDAEAALARAKAEYAYSLNNLHRVEPLLQKQFVTVDQVDQLRTRTAAQALAVKQAAAQLELARARLTSSEASLLASSSNVSRAQAQHQQSQSSITTLAPLTAQRGARTSAISDAEYKLENCVVRAPFDARVTNLTLSEGAYAHAGTQVFTLIDTRVWWVIANFRETQLHRILPGMHVDVYLMSDPHRLYRGVVDSASFGVTPDASTIGMLTNGLPDAQRTLSWVHLASRYPVRIRILDPEPEAFRISESAVVEVRGWHGW